MWALDQMPSTELNENAEGDFYQHTVLNDDWDLFTIFEKLDLLGCSEARFTRFLEELLHPVVRDIEDQPGYAEALNKHLARDGLELRAVDAVSGYPVYRVVPRRAGVQGQSKNIIFAANGPKPEIVLRDAINNDVEIVKNAEYCLVFDRPIPPDRAPLVGSRCLVGRRPRRRARRKGDVAPAVQAPGGVARLPT